MKNTWVIATRLQQIEYLRPPLNNVEIEQYSDGHQISLAKMFALFTMSIHYHRLQKN